MDLAPDGHSLILVKANMEILYLQPGDAPSVIWDRAEIHPILLSTHKEYGAFYLSAGHYPQRLCFLQQKESREVEDRLDFFLNLENPSGNSQMITQAKPESGSSFLCASSDGELWRVAGRTQEGEWITGNIWQKKVAAPEVQALETDPSCASIHNWMTEPHLETQLHRKIHSDSVTALHVLPELLVTASKDRDVKLWEKTSMQLLGLFRCEGAASCLEPSLGPDSTLRLAVGDTQGNVYFLSWE